MSIPFEQNYSAEMNLHLKYDFKTISFKVDEALFIVFLVSLKRNTIKFYDEIRVE